MVFDIQNAISCCSFTGTPLGDPIEMGALGQALKGPTQSSIGISSAKACFGHTEGSAGLSGALLAVQCLNMATLPPIMHLRSPNPYVEAAMNDWRMQHQLSSELPRSKLSLKSSTGREGDIDSDIDISGTSSFGMSGINAHMLLCAGANKAKVS